MSREETGFGGTLAEPIAPAVGRAWVKARRRSSRIVAAAVCAAGLVMPVALSGCGNPTQSTSNCAGVSDGAVRAIQQRITGAETLRNVRMVHLRNGEYAFVSGELHPHSDDPHQKGDIATWATRDIKSADDFLAVDVHAREESTWPHASFDVTADGAIESRACTGLSRGKTPAQVACEQAEAAGQSAGLPSGKKCSDL